MNQILFKWILQGWVWMDYAFVMWPASSYMSWFFLPLWQMRWVLLGFLSTLDWTKILNWISSQITRPWLDILMNMTSSWPLCMVLWIIQCHLLNVLMQCTGLHHCVFVWCRFGMLGSVDANTGSPDLGWDTDQFPMDIRNTTLVMKVT